MFWGVERGGGILVKMGMIIQKTIKWPPKEFTIQELISMNQHFDSLTLQFFVNRRLSEGTLARSKESAAKFRVKQP